MNTSPQLGIWTTLGHWALRGHWMRGAAERRRASASSRTQTQGPGGSRVCAPSPVAARPIAPTGGANQTVQGRQNGCPCPCTRTCSSRHRGRLANLRTLVGIALLALTALGAAGTAHAEVLVSNTAQTLDGGTSNAFQAQSFETGTNTAGNYTITNVQVRLHGVDAGESTSVKIRDNQGGVPGDVVAILSNRTALTNGLNTFTAPANTTLEASTTYWISISEGISSRVNISRTGSSAETGATGWVIGNGRLWRTQANRPAGVRIQTLQLQWPSTAPPTPTQQSRRRFQTRRRRRARCSAICSRRTRSPTRTPATR